MAVKYGAALEGSSDWEVPLGESLLLCRLLVLLFKSRHAVEKWLKNMRKILSAHLCLIE